MKTAPVQIVATIPSSVDPLRVIVKDVGGNEEVRLQLGKVLDGGITFELSKTLVAKRGRKRSRVSSGGSVLEGIGDAQVFPPTEEDQAASAQARRETTHSGAYIWDDIYSAADAT